MSASALRNKEFELELNGRTPDLARHWHAHATERYAFEADKAWTRLTMASIATAEANDGQQENEKDQFLVTLLSVVAIIIAFFTLRALARMSSATGVNWKVQRCLRPHRRKPTG